MKRKANGQINIVVAGIGRAQPKRSDPAERRGKSAGSAAHHFQKGCPPGPAFRKGVQRRTIPKFSDAYEVALLQEVPAALRKRLGVPKGTTMMDVLVQRVVQEAAIGASIPHVVELRETTQGKTANKNLNVSAELESYISNPEFQQFIAEKLQEFLAQQRLSVGDNE